MRIGRGRRAVLHDRRTGKPSAEGCPPPPAASGRRARAPAGTAGGARARLRLKMTIETWARVGGVGLLGDEVRGSEPPPAMVGLIVRRAGHMVSGAGRAITRRYCCPTWTTGIESTLSSECSTRLMVPTLHLRLRRRLVDDAAASSAARRRTGTAAVHRVDVRRPDLELWITDQNVRGQAVEPLVTAMPRM